MALAVKGVSLPDMWTLMLTRKRLAQTSAERGRRGIVKKLGTGKGGKRA